VVLLAISSFVFVQAHPHFRREGTDGDVYCTASLPFPHAILGTQLEVPSMYGETLNVDISPGTQHGQVIKLSGQGFPNSKGTQGDMFIQIHVAIPPGPLDENEKKLLQKLATKKHFRVKRMKEFNKV